MRSLRADPLDPAVVDRVLELVLDVIGSTIQSLRRESRTPFVEHALGVSGNAGIWFDGRRSEPAHAALVNGTRAHHAELDDGHPEASFHGGVCIIPAAVAIGESVEATGAELIESIARGYAAAAYCGRPRRESIVAAAAHPPARIGCFGAAAATAHLLKLDRDTTTAAMGLVESLLPAAPFESFTRGASVKDAYGGYPSYLGVQAARWAQAGLAGPDAGYDAGEIDLAEVLRVEIKPWPSCRSTHAVLTALESLLPFEHPVENVRVETYPFAFALSEDSDASTAIGRKASIPHVIEDNVAGVEARQVDLTSASELAPSGARVTVRLTNGREATADTDRPRSENDIIAKFRGNAGDRSDPIEDAVLALPRQSATSALRDALSTPI